MKMVRTLISVFGVVLLVLGYGASQYAALTGTAQEYAQKVDCPPIKWLALILLVLCVFMAFIGDREADES